MGIVTGLVPIDEQIYFDICTHDPSTGGVSDADSTPTFSVFEEATDTPIVSGTSFTKRTSLTGDYRGTFTASAANGFEAGKWYSVIASATVGGIAAKKNCGSFRVAPAETVAGVPKGDVSHVGGTAQTAGDIIADTNDIQTRLPAALTGAGNLKADAQVVSDKTGYALTGAYDLAKTAAQAGDAMTLSGDLTATMKTSVTTAATAATPTVTAGTVSDKTGYALTSAYDAAKTAATQTSVDDLPTNAELATALGTADDAVLAAIAALNNLSSAGAQSAAAAALTAYGAALQTTALAVKAKTDNLTFTSGTDLDVNVQKVNDVALLGDGSATPWGPA